MKFKFFGLFYKCFYNKFIKKENSQMRLKKIMNDRGLRQVDILEKSKPFQDKLGLNTHGTKLQHIIMFLIVLL